MCDPPEVGLSQCKRTITPIERDHFLNQGYICSCALLPEPQRVLKSFGLLPRPPLITPILTCTPRTRCTCHYQLCSPLCSVSLLSLTSPSSSWSFCSEILEFATNGCHRSMFQWMAVPLPRLHQGSRSHLSQWLQQNCTQLLLPWIGTLAHYDCFCALWIITPEFKSVLCWVEYCV